MEYIEVFRSWICRLDEAERHGEDVTQERTMVCAKVVRWCEDRLNQSKPAWWLGTDENKGVAHVS